MAENNLAVTKTKTAAELGEDVKANAKKSAPVTTFVGMNSLQIGNFLQEKYALQIAQLLPVTNKLGAERAISQAVLVISQNEALKECTPQSVIGSIMKAAMYGFNPNTEMGQCWFIPYNNNKQINGQWVTKKECQFQIGVRGWVKMLQNTGLVKRIINKAVHIEDEFSEVCGSKSEIIHKPCGKQVTWETLHCAYAIIEIILKDSKGKTLLDATGQVITGVYDLVMYKEEIDRLRKKGVKTADKSKLQGGWVDDAGEMGKAKVLKKLIKDELSHSDELMGVVDIDEKVFDITEANMATRELKPVSVESESEPENVEVLEVQEVVEAQKEKPFGEKIDIVSDIFADVRSGKLPITALTPSKEQVALICELISDGVIDISVIPDELLKINKLKNAVFEIEKKAS